MLEKFCNCAHQKKYEKFKRKLNVNRSRLRLLKICFIIRDEIMQKSNVITADMKKVMKIQRHQWQ